MSSLANPKRITLLAVLIAALILVTYSFCVLGKYSPPSDNQKNIAFLKTVIEGIEEAEYFYSEDSWVFVAAGGMGRKIETKNPVYECITTRGPGDFSNSVVYYRFNRLVPPDSPINIHSHVESISVSPLMQIYVVIERLLASVYMMIVLLCLIAGIATWCLVYWHKNEGGKLAFDEKRSCKGCGAEISRFSTRCPKCGVSQNEDGE